MSINILAIKFENNINDIQKILFENVFYTKDELLEINKFINKKDKLLKSTSIFLQKYVINKILNVKYEDIIINFNKYKKPFFSLENKNIYFNVSHDFPYIVIAYSINYELGIDIVNTNRTINFKNFKNTFSIKEWNYIKNSNNPKNTFFKFWCLKESYIKCIGKGLTLNLKI